MQRRVFMKLRRLAALTGALALLGFSGCIPDFMMPKGEKPVLYLYPPEETTVTVSLSLHTAWMPSGKMPPTKLSFPRLSSHSISVLA